jgi:hypothetical protein
MSYREIHETAHKRGTSFLSHEAHRENGNKHYISEKKEAHKAIGRRLLPKQQTLTSAFRHM